MLILVGAETWGHGARHADALEAARARSLEGALYTTGEEKHYAVLAAA